MDFKICLVLCFLSLHLSSGIQLDGEVTIGAILGIHEPPTSGKKCGPINYRGVAVSEAIKLAVREINKDNNILGQGSNKKTVGYHINDSCGTVDRGKDIAYVFNTNKRATSGSTSNSKNTTKEAISVVIGAFKKDYLPVIKLLSFEKIPQISYSPDNVRLNRDKSVDKEDIRLLLSAFPEDTTKMRAVADLISTLAFQHVYIVSSDDKRGTDGEQILKAELKQMKICYSADMTITNKQSAKRIIAKIASNKLITVVVLHCEHDKAMYVFEEAKAQNITHLIFISTYSWRAEDLLTLKIYAKELEGMVYVGDAVQRPQGYHQYIEKIKEPFKDAQWLQEAFLKEGGPKKCLSDNEVERQNENCKTAREKLIVKLRLEGHAAATAIDAVYATVYAIEERSRKGLKKAGLLDYIKETEFVSSLTGNIIRFNQEGIVLSNSFVLYNVIGNSSTSFDKKRVGTWRVQDTPPLVLNKKILRWKNSSYLVPRARCSADCVKGTRKMPFPDDVCCWECEKCPNDTISNKTNSPSCITCEDGYTPNPSQSKCYKYDAIYFHWYEPSGECMIFFITAGLCVTLFTLGIFSQNSESPVVKTSGFKLMFFMLLGVGLTFITPVPLFVRPSTMMCSIYVIIFNFSLTIPLSVLVTKTSAFTTYFLDEDGEVKRGTLTSRPRIVLILIILALQGVIMGVGLAFLPSKVNVLETEHWDVKYLECDSHRNYIFWIGFSYNTLLSIVINFLSCSAKDMEVEFGELKWISMTICIYYLIALLYISVLFAVFGKHLVEGAGVMVILFGFTFLSAYFFPKLYYILFRSDKTKTGIEASPLMHEEEEHVHTHSSVATPFQHHGILSVKIKDVDESNA